jgi:hypothetical protein
VSTAAELKATSPLLMRLLELLPESPERFFMVRDMNYTGNRGSIRRAADGHGCCKQPDDQREQRGASPMLIAVIVVAPTMMISKPAAASGVSVCVSAAACGFAIVRLGCRSSRACFDHL